MIVHTITDYHAEPLFPVLCEQAKARVKEVFATGLFMKKESINSELNTAVSKAVEETIGDIQADSDMG